MKKTVSLILAVIFVLAVGGCPTDDGLGGGQQGTGNYAKEFRGEWIRMDTGDRWYIDGSSISVNGAASTLNVRFEKTSENVIDAYGEDNKRYTLFGARTANASFNAQVVLLDDASRSATGSRTVGDERVTVRNLKQPDLPIVVQPNNTGEIVVLGQIPGDTLEIVPNSSEWKDVKVGITPGFGKEQNLGVIPLTNGDNFKVSLKMGNEADDITELYADLVPRDYIFELENIGKTNSGETTFELSWNESDFVYLSGTTKQEFSNIASGEKKQLTLRLASKTIDAEKMNKEVKIKIKNYDSKSHHVRTWDDTVSINFYKVPTTLWFSSEKQVQGVIKAKSGKSYYFRTVRPEWSTGNFTTSVNVPWSNYEYIVTFLGATIEAESATKYAFAETNQPYANWDSYDPYIFLSTYKPYNEVEDTAPVVETGKGSFMGYLAGESIDYYKVRLRNSSPTPSVYTVTFNANSATAGTAPAAVTWGSGTIIQLPLQGDMEKTGYAFDGWSLNSAGTGAKYDAGASYTVTGGVTLYARWNFIYTVTFDKNTADAESAEADPQTKTGISPASLGTLPKPPVRPGYNFAGWNTKADGSGTSFTGTTAVTEDKTVYAKWQSTAVPGAALEDKLTWLRTNAIDNGFYIVEVTADESILPQTLSYTGKTNVTICLKADTEMRTISLSVNGSLFTVQTGVTLILDNNITLNGKTENNTSLVYVYGTLEMREGSFVTGNQKYIYTSTSNVSGGGVYISGGTFTMSGGEISGNTAYARSGDFNFVTSNAYGGGVCVSGGSFTMSGGKISGNTAQASSQSFSSGSTSSYAYGGGVYVSGGTFTMSGGEIYGNTAYAGNSYGGGVCLGYGGGTFTKTGGTIYGYTSGDTNSNTFKNDGRGSAVYVSYSKYRETTAGPTVNLDSSKDGAAGGW
jgi:uncharacterized repeat protein (TIGR02543 family)